MEIRSVSEDYSGGIFLSPEELWGRLEKLSQKAFSLTALEFVEAYAAGKLNGYPVAGDIAALVPFTRRPL